MTAWLFRLEAIAARMVLALFRALGPVTASNLGGWVARMVGPILPVSRVAETNLILALPELDSAGRRRVVRGAWENLGRTVAEFPHLATLREGTSAGPGWDAVGTEHLASLVAQGGPGIFFSGHIGNWEMLPIACAANGVPLASMFRAAANPEVDALIQALRRQTMAAEMPMFPKGAVGARQAVGHLRSGGFLGLLMDQKMNDGIEARLFGHPAMTAPALALLALRFRCPVIPGYVQRVGPARFRLVCEPPVALPDSGNSRADIQAMTQAVNDCLERWIRQRPESWLWMHRRWPKHLYRHPPP